MLSNLKDRKFPKRRYKKEAKEAKENNIRLYAIFLLTDKSDPSLKAFDPNDTLLSYTATEQEALQTLERITYLNNYSHFVNWAALHDDNPDRDKDGYKTDTSFLSPLWIRYTKINGDSLFSNRYKILSIDTSKEDIVSMMRMGKKLPLWGMPYEDDMEITTYLYRHGLTSPDEASPEFKLMLSTASGEFQAKSVIAFVRAKRVFDKNQRKAKEDEDKKPSTPDA